MLDFIPFVGSIKGAFEAFTGVDVITGETLSASDRWTAGIGSILGALPIPGAKQGGKYLTKGTIELEEQLEKSLVSAGTSKYRLPMDLQLFAGKAGSGAKLPLGSKHNQMNQPKNPFYQPVRNTSTSIDGIEFSGHALDRMQDRGILPSIVKSTIEKGTPNASRGGTVKYYDKVNNVSVVTNSDGKVVTVSYGK
ncbi:hypothetical protein B7C51_02640 [Paenibacillus larvae subsp. pulvifaciens]|uniref:Pre-toxin TG domain-containing protein n=1 Tax=Paenibacillus larvae subsp. pulvifaciens TaxID=1477 RepID=A0A1V0UPQ6_9BACL|nr:pre-toxin TG domain-containing protein [Paenibacillus larvae]ARF66938.1 hypothetical protein B7C51_02640 [Paenibacillus larvae subsp. pulvifaciens]